VGDGIAGDAVDARSLVEILDAVEIFEGADDDLAGSGGCAFAGGGEGEGRAGAQAEDAADDAGSPMAMPTSWASPERCFIHCSSSRLSVSERAVLTILTKSGWKRWIRA
jgi:hypothetical protein